MSLTYRDFLLRLVLVPGIGRTSALKCWRWLTAHQLAVTPTTLPTILTASGLTTKQTRTAVHDLFSPELTVRVTTNLQRVHALTLADAAYPTQLREIYEPPVVLYYQGELTRLNRPQLAVVGSRRPTPYALAAIKALLPAVVRQGVCLVSGLAQGVDTLGHQVALAHHGTTIAVIGTGHDHCYPAKNRELMNKLAHDQLVLSEYPPSAGATRFKFVERNRIIAGLAQSVLIVEAAAHSGSLITANLALQENRNVLAIPGNITAPNSVGTNQLILAGAKPILNSEHIMEEVFLDKRS